MESNNLLLENYNSSSKRFRDKIVDNLHNFVIDQVMMEGNETLLDKINFEKKQFLKMVNNVDYNVNNIFTLEDMNSNYESIENLKEMAFKANSDYDTIASLHHRTLVSTMASGNLPENVKNTYNDARIFLEKQFDFDHVTENKLVYDFSSEEVPMSFYE